MSEKVLFKKKINNTQNITASRCRCSWNGHP